MPVPAPTDPKPPYNSFVRFSGFAFQLLGGIGIMGWIGYKLDQYLNLSFPAFMLSFIILTLSGMLYQINKTLNKE